MDLTLRILGQVHSPFTDKASTPKCEHEGGAEARIEIAPACAEAAETLAEGQEVWLFTWLHLGDRSRLKVHPRGDRSRPMRGVFNTRSPDRPNPIGLHKVRITGIEAAPSGGVTLVVSQLEALDGTPVIDLKPVI
jgi:L-fuculose-phosphate aldolase